MIGCSWTNSKRLLNRRRIVLLDELPQRAQVIGPVALRGLAGLFDLVVAVLVGQGQQSHQHAHTLDAAILEHRLRPLHASAARCLPPGAAARPCRARCR